MMCEIYFNKPVINKWTPIQVKKEWKEIRGELQIWAE